MMARVDIPEVHAFSSIIERAKIRAASGKPRAALVVPSDIDSLKALIEAASAGLIEPVIIGDEQLLNRNAEEHSIDIGPAKVIDINQPDMAIATAIRMAAASEVELIVQGRVEPADLLDQLFSSELGFLVPGRTVSHVAVMKPEKYAKLLMLTDSVIVIQPDLEMKLKLIDNLVSVSNAIGIPDPRVAVLGAVEVVYPQMPATMEAAILAKMSERGQIRGARVDGPLSFDVAVDPRAATCKGIQNSQVAGQADALLAPCIEVAHGVYTAMSLYGRCEMGGVIVGGKVPVVVCARTDPVRARFNSITLAVLTGGNS